MHTVKQQVFWFITLLTILLGIVLMDHLYPEPERWGIYPYIKSPYILSIYPFVHECVIQCIAWCCMVGGGYTLRTILMYYFTTNIMDKASERNRLENLIESSLIRIKRLNQEFALKSEWLSDKKRLNQAMCLNNYNIVTIENDIKLAREKLAKLSE